MGKKKPIYYTPLFLAPRYLDDRKRLAATKLRAKRAKFFALTLSNNFRFDNKYHKFKILKDLDSIPPPEEEPDDGEFSYEEFLVIARQ